MNAHDAERFLLSLSNLPKPHTPAHRARGLIRMRRLLQLLGNPHKQLHRVIHIAGTSAKGSVATYLSHIAIAAGHKTGLMISPHPTHIRERWQINGKPIDQETFYECTRLIANALDQYQTTYRGDLPTHFEILTAIGFLCFAKAQVTWAVIEVGLGGRHDATNVFNTKDAAVITTIGKDHMDVLGNTLVDIAREKSGIITRGCRVWTMESRASTLEVIKKEVKKQQAHIQTVSYHESQILNQGIDGIDFTYNNIMYHLSSIGTHQVRNAILAIEVSKGLGYAQDVIARGLAATVQPLRMEVVSHKPLIILDGAHNPDKMKTTVETIYEIRHAQKYENIHLIVGFSADKEWKRMVQQSASLNPTSVACTRNTANPFRKVVNPADIAAQFQKTLPYEGRAGVGFSTRCFLDPRDALAWAMTKMQKKHDILLITGSIFLSGELRPLLLLPEK